MPMSPRLLRPRAAVSAAFDPRTITGLQVWYDAADSSSVTLNSGNVSEWRDKSGNGRHATQASAGLQPVYRTAFQNGRNVLGFNSGKVLGFTVPVGSESTLFLVTTPSSTDNAYIIATGDIINGSSPAIISRFLVTSVRRDFEWYSFFDPAPPSGGVTDRVILATAQAGFSVVAVSHSGTSSMFGYVNGPQTGTKAPLGVSIASRNYTLLGASSAAAANSANCDVAEVLAYNRVLSSAERTAVTQALGSKWAITIT